MKHKRGTTQVKIAFAISLLALTFAAQISSANGARADILIADFEGPTYGSWSVTGTAFGSGPARGTLPGQLPVTGFVGHGLANSFVGGDAAMGSLTSPEFVIERNYINFLIGGGSVWNRTCMNLLVEGRPERTASGHGSESMSPASWEVSGLIGRKARIQIVDAMTGPWGHILVDQIVQSDNPTPIVLGSTIPLTPQQRRMERMQQIREARAAQANANVGTPYPLAATPQTSQPITTYQAQVQPNYRPYGRPIQPAQPPSGGLATTAALAPGQSANLRLDEFSHALDVQLVDKLGASKLFSVVEEKDIKDLLHAAPAVEDSNAAGHRKLAIAGVNAVPTLANRYGLPVQPPPYDLKNKETLGQFGSSSINFLLITTVEDMDENHLDGVTVTRDFEYVSGQKTGWWVEELGADSGGIRRASHEGGSSSSWRRETVKVNPMLQKEQSLRVTLRSRLYNAKNGELLGSKNKTYARGRSYMASARGNNEMSMGDLYQGAAQDLADWELTIVEDQAFPIKVVKIEDEGLLINRGSESGIAKNSYYTVWVVGDELKDPDTGEPLGREEKQVGKVLITELQSRLSRAKIVDDKGIKPGAVLRWTRE